MPDAVIAETDPGAQAVRVVLDALWEEIQQRYGFRCAEGIAVAAFARFWVATADGTTVGGVGLRRGDPATDGAVELDGMYVAPAARGTGCAQRLLETCEQAARSLGYREVRLRTGEPQPEAVRCYTKSGYARIPRFGRWRTDDTAWCYAKTL